MCLHMLIQSWNLPKCEKFTCLQIHLFYFPECKWPYTQRIILIGITDTFSFYLTLCKLLYFPFLQVEVVFLFLLKRLKFSLLKMKKCYFNNEFFTLPRVKTCIKYVESVYVVWSWLIRAFHVILSGWGKEVRKKV